MADLLRSFDLISPPNILYYKKNPSHKSLVGAILTIISLILCILFVIVIFIDSVRRSFPIRFMSYKKYIGDPGQYEFKPKKTERSFFHYIQILNMNNTPIIEDTDSKFWIIGKLTDNNSPLNLNPVLDNSTEVVLFSNYSLSDEDAWLYSPCTDSDKGDYSNIINDDTFKTSFCLKHYYNSDFKAIYPEGDESFIYPKLGEGGLNKAFNIQLIKCSYDQYIRKDPLCLLEEDIDSYFKDQLLKVKFSIIDNEIDISDRSHPDQSFVNEITTDLFTDSVFNNDLTFNQVKIKTDKGVLFNIVKEINTLRMENNERTVYSKTEYPYLLSSWTIRVGNKQEIFYRKYYKMQNFFSIAGGTCVSIWFIFEMINYFVNLFIVTIDMQVFYNETAEHSGKYKGKAVYLEDLKEKSEKNVEMKSIINDDDSKIDDSKREVGKKDLQESKINQTLVKAKKIHVFTFSEFIKGILLCDNNTKSNIEVIQNFWKKYVSEENLLKSSIQLSSITGEFNNLVSQIQKNK
ncbi:MAG: hypothetical protein MJ252_04415 [archaeon]|nr:hypothetical protein [archaeon]